jgi:FixJ family two-component response regulator
VKAFSSAGAFSNVAAFMASGCVIDMRSLRQKKAPRALNAARSDLPVIVLTPIEGDVALAVESLKAGAADFIEVRWGDARLLEAVAAAHDTILRAEEERKRGDECALRITDMSVREREVLDRLLVGGTNKTIARDLGISPRTVEVHRAHLMERLGAHNLPEAVRLALAAGLAPPARAPAERARP